MAEKKAAGSHPNDTPEHETVHGIHHGDQAAASDEISAASASKPEAAHPNDKHESTMASKAATVAVIGLGAALIEVEWIPGMIIGAAAVLAPDLIPKVGRGFRPFLKGAIRAGYSFTERARETIAEASEQIQDIAAEVKAEHGHKAAPTGPATHQP